MSEIVTTTVRIDSEVKDEACRVFKALGLNFSAGIDVYLRTVARERRIPFDLSLSDHAENDNGR